MDPMNPMTRAAVIARTWAHSWAKAWFADPHGISVTMVLSATFGLAFKAIFARLAFDTGLTVPAVLVWRMALAVPAFWIAASFFLKGSPIIGSLRMWWLTAGPGALFAIATIADFQAIALTGAGISRMVLFTFPLIVVLMTAVKDRTAPPKRHIAAFVIAYAGLMAVIAPGLDGIPGLVDRSGFLTGLVWSMVSAISYAAYLVFGQYFVKRIGSVRFTVQANTWAALGVLGWAFLTEPVSSFAITTDGLTWMSLMVLISTVAPMLLLIEGMKRIGPGRGSLLTLSGPVVTVLAAWVLLGETFNALQIGGFALVFLGMAVLEGLVGKKAAPDR